MFRNLIGFALLAVVAWFSLQLVLGLFGIFIGVLGKVIWLAFLGFLVYLVLRIFAPATADRVKEAISGKPGTSM
jgi:hypothetical protein